MNHQEETKKPAKVEATTKVMNLTHAQESKQRKHCRVKESERKRTLEDWKEVEMLYGFRSLAYN